MGRILRTGIDTVVNYTFLATSAYDAGNPAATTGAWPDSAAMDQLFTQASPTEVTEQGCLVTFSRFPDTFSGAQVKLHPTYDTSTNENPFFEMWVHASDTGLWTLRASIQLSNPFVGIASGAHKVLDFTFFPFARKIDKVWLTMNPGIGAPVMRFDAIQLFGQCEGALRTGVTGGAIQYTCDPSKADPFATPPIVYTGFKVIYSSTPPFITHVPCDPFLPHPCAATLPDLCNPVSVSSYRECLRGIDDGGTSLNAFDSWFTLNNALIASNCAGNTDTPLPNPPIPPLPPLPALDLCSQVSIDAFRAAVSGDAGQLAAFNSFIDALTQAGYFALVCPPEDPPAVYVDPVTQAPGTEPAGGPRRPFGAGPGGDPPPNPPLMPSVPPKAPGTGGGGQQEFIAFFFNNSNTYNVPAPGSTPQQLLEFLVSAGPPELLDAWNAKDQIVNVPDFSSPTPRRLQLTFSGLVSGTAVGVRIIQFDPNGPVNMETLTTLFSGATQTLCVVNTSAGIFGSSHPQVSDPFFVIFRDATSAVPILRLATDNTITCTMPGGGGFQGIFVNVRATPPAGSNTIITVVASVA